MKTAIDSSVNSLQNVWLMTKRKILHDTINVGCTKDLPVAQPTTALGILSLKQVPFARAMEKHFAGTGYFEAFCY